NPVLQVWPFDGTGAPILHQDNVIFLVALMESDDGSARADKVRDRVQADLLPKLLGYKSSNLDRKTIVGKLSQDMLAVINSSRRGDDGIGGDTQELRLTASDLQTARQGYPEVEKTLICYDGIGTDPPRYDLTFVLQNPAIIIF